MEYTIKIPSDISFEYRDNTFIFSKDSTKIVKKNPVKLVDVVFDNGEIKIKAKIDRRKAKAQAKTLASLIENYISGLNKPYKYKLGIVYSHFPMNVSVKNNAIVVSNFAGAKKDIVIPLLDNVSVSVKGKFIEVVSSDKEKAGQMAANIENKVKVKRKDRRIFQDGIYIIEKGVQDE